MSFPKPRTSTYTQMARAVGVDHLRVYTSTTRKYYRIKLYDVSYATRTANMLRRLFPEARVVPLPRMWSSASVVLYFDR